MKESWYDLEGFGPLYRQADLVTGNGPVLFVCVDEHGDRYLVITYDPCVSEYVFARIGDTCLADMLENRITMEQAYRNADIIWLTEDTEGEKLKVKACDPKSFPPDMLPAAGRYFELQTGYISRYIDSLKTDIAGTKAPEETGGCRPEGG